MFFRGFKVKKEYKAKSKHNLII